MKKFIDEFNIRKKIQVYDEVEDYNVFPNKILLDNLRNKIVQNLIDGNIENYKSMNDYVKHEIDKTLEGYDLTNNERDYVYNLIDNEINGNGPLTPLLNNPLISEIMVNGVNDIYIEVEGKVIKDTTISFINDNHILRIIQKMIQPLGRTIDTAHPMVDARLNDGSRLNAVIPPLSLKGPILTIRKFKKDMQTIEDFLRTGTLTPSMARFLEACVHAKLNIIICGGTGSGKTSLLNILSSFIEHDERIITIEDAAELRLKQEHVVGMETRLTNYEKEGEVTIRDLVINSLRMRPDRIIVGEVRGKEAFDMLQAMNTGHAGSMTTMHANGPQDAMNRLETMILMAGMDIPVKAIREYIGNAIDIIIQIERLQDGKRKITSISEIIGFKEDNIEIKEIYKFKTTGVNENNDVLGEFLMYKRKPHVCEKITSCGIRGIDTLFKGE